MAANSAAGCVLVVTANCITENLSASLCNQAYLRALLDEGYWVDLLSAEGHENAPDPSMEMPAVSHHYIYKSISVYERARSWLRPADKGSQGASADDLQKPSAYKKGVWGTIKRLARKTYGVYGIQRAWYRRAIRFRAEKPYDIVLSVSNPAIGHCLAKKLLSNGRVKAEKWIQIWQDPWSDDLCLIEDPVPIRAEEARLLAAADRIVYVSPITCMRQRELFPASADKMSWHPLPYYYAREEPPVSEQSSGYVYGHFGDYFPFVRNIRPFCEVAAEDKLKATICGNPGNIFASTETVRFTGRLPLLKLKEYEREANVLVFLCNLRGGQIPGKIYTYSATGKTILFILDGTEGEKRILHAYFGQFHRYVFCDNTKASIREAISRIEQGQTGVDPRPLSDTFSPRTIMRAILREAGF